MGAKEQFYAEIAASHSEVTGSTIPVIVRFPDNQRVRFVVDLGLFQEKDHLDFNNTLRFDPEDIDFVAITHNHIDHLGRIPMLASSGFTGKVFVSTDTSKLMKYALEDSCNILHSATSKKTDVRLYSKSDVDKILTKVSVCPMRETLSISRNIKLTMFENGHLVGASILLFQISYPGYNDINLLFTGDINFHNMFFDVPPLPDWVLALPITIVTESTYGTTNSSEIETVFERNVVDSIESGKNVLCTAFSLGRFQEILLVLKSMFDTNKLSDDVLVYCDGKLARRYSELYVNGDLNIHDDMTDFYPDNCTFLDTISRRSVLDQPGQKIIVTTSGMGTYGPATYYIPNIIPRDDWIIHFTGYGLYGQRLRDTPDGDSTMVSGLSKIKRAQVYTTSEFSSHAKADQLISFIDSFENPKFVLVNHGETTVKDTFAKRIVEEIPKTKDVAILDRQHRFRVNPYGWSATKTSAT